MKLNNLLIIFFCLILSTTIINCEQVDNNEQSASKLQPTNCTTVLCPQILCQVGYTSYLPPGKCCRICVKKPCPPCPIVDCLPGYYPVKDSDGCCDTCKLDCRRPCPLIKCAKGYLPQTKKGQCCPTCVKQECPLINCMSPFVPVTVEGEECKKCGEDCRLVKCAKPVCSDGQEPIKNPLECCYKCPPLNCAAVLCKACLPDQESTSSPLSCCPICKSKTN